jgi:two-component system, OmpR family, response regulator
VGGDRSCHLRWFCRGIDDTVDVDLAHRLSQPIRDDSHRGRFCANITTSPPRCRNLICEFQSDDGDVDRGEGCADSSRICPAGESPCDDKQIDIRLGVAAGDIGEIAREQVSELPVVDVWTHPAQVVRIDDSGPMPMGFEQVAQFDGHRGFPSAGNTGQDERAHALSVDGAGITREVTFRGNTQQTQNFCVPAGRILSFMSSPSAPLTREDGSPVRVLVVDDEPTLAELLTSVLRYEGWTVQSAGTGLDAVRIARELMPDAVVLDMMLPDIDGLEVLRRLRAHKPDVCVLFLTAKDSVEDRVAGITAGGDDYVTKPFSLEEVLARLRGLLRRAGATRIAQGDLITVGDLTMDEDSREVRRAGNLIDLTPTEFELLRYLIRNPKRVLTKAQILDRVWDYDFGGQAHIVELYISYLRKKIDADRDPMIHTVRGVGYVLRPAE